ncbi:MAG: formate/nitrite transporter family protein [Actinobacteria bacterium]|nr:formate/nitrite transporter family protein [Actinomycetota bacterium]
MSRYTTDPRRQAPPTDGADLPPPPAGRRPSRRGLPTKEERSQSDEELQGAFVKTVDEARRRLNRSWPSLFATGTVGGIDVGLGVLALLLVKEATGQELLAALAFSIGFIAITLGRSELFTENFLVPVTAVVTGKSSVGTMLRLWSGTAVTNLAGGWVFMALVSVGLPELRQTAVDLGRHYPEMGIGSTTFASAVIGGAAITLMTWMQRGTDSVPAKLVAAVAIAFLLAGGRLNHAIVVSLEMFAALHVGAPFGYADWLGMASWAALGNLVGGIALVTVLRLVQIGRTALDAERQRPDEPRAPEEDSPGVPA